MQIEGPLNIGVVDNSDSNSRELHISFTAEFQQKSLDERLKDFREHIASLNRGIQATEDVSSQHGMLTILQISEQLLPHLEADEIPLEESIVIEIGQSSPLDQLLNKATL